MAAMAPPKPTPWAIDRSGLTRAGRKFWPMDLCAPLWETNGLLFRDYAQGLVGHTEQSPSVLGYQLSHTGRSGALAVETQRNRTGSADDTVGIVFDGYRPGTSGWPMSFFWRGLLDDDTSSWRALVGVHDRSASNAGVGIAMRNSLARVYARNGFSSPVYAESTTVVPDGTVLNVAGVNRANADRSVWRDGRERGNSTGTSSFSANVDSVAIGFWSDSSDGQYFDVPHECAYVWPYELAAGMLAELEEDPYLPFRKGAFVFGYRTPAAATGGTILPQMMQVA